MFFSTDTGRLPVVGDLVCPPDGTYPLQVVARFKDRIGNVFLDVEGKEHVVYRRQRVEIYRYWPQIGDAVLVSVADYLNWLADQQVTPVLAQVEPGGSTAIARRLQAYSEDVIQLLCPFEFVAESDGMATIKPTAGRSLAMPVHCLRVLAKADGRVGA